MNNYSSVVQITLGLQNHAVERLRKSWRKVSEGEMARFQRLVAFSAFNSNFKNVRAAMNNLSHLSLPCVPFLGMYLSDLIMGAEMPNEVGPGGRSLNRSSETPEEPHLINYFKHSITAAAVRKVRRFQDPRLRYHFFDSPVHPKILNLVCLENQQLDAMSLAREPRT